MKNSIYLVLVAFLIAVGCSKNDDDLNAVLKDSQLKPATENQLNAKSPKKETTAHSWLDYANFDLWCGDNIVDHISGTLNFHCVMQFENDVLLFMNMTYNGFLTGESGEVFKYKEITTFDLSKNDSSENFHFNAIGDRGSHFIVSGKYLYLNEEPWVIVDIDKARCSE
jgi:hypothetical protein